MEQNKYEESRKVSLNMMKHGGSFVAALGLALQNADAENTAAIKAAFPEYWKQYLNL